MLIVLAAATLGAATVAESRGAGAPMLAAAALLVWAHSAIAAKRFHDRNMSGWWYLAYFALPFTIAYFWFELTSLFAINAIEATTFGSNLSIAGTAVLIFMHLELGITRGTRGGNRFGPDPEGGPPPAAP